MNWEQIFPFVLSMSLNFLILFQFSHSVKIHVDATEFDRLWCSCASTWSSSKFYLFLNYLIIDIYIRVNYKFGPYALHKMARSIQMNL